MTEEGKLIHVQKPNRRRGEGFSDMGSKTEQEWVNHLSEFDMILDIDDKAAINKALKAHREKN